MKWAEEFEKERQLAIKHIDFCLELMRGQQQRGRYFLFEHPAYATSWKLPQMQEFLNSPGVDTTIGDMCMYGLVTPNKDRTGFLPAKKPTQFMSNSWYVLKELGTRCDHSHEHQHLMGGRASRAAEYAFKLCMAICRGLRRQKAYDQSGKTCSGAMNVGQLKSMIASIRKWHAEDYVSSVVGPSGSGSGLARATDDGSLAPENDQDGTDQSHCRNPSVGGGKMEPPVDIHNIPSHWQDDKHEPDGKDFWHIAVEPKVISANPLTPEQIIQGPLQFTTGVNIGAITLEEQMGEIENRILRLGSLTTDQWGKFTCRDDVSGDIIDPTLVQAARELEVEYLKRMRVYEVVPRTEIYKSGHGKAIKGRWLDINKGDSTNPDVRSRYVGKEFATGVDATLYAGLPPARGVEGDNGHRRE